MLFSIVIPCFNLADYLPETLESVSAQTYPGWECLIVNDGSTDNTEEIGREWSERDSRFKLFNKKNGGVSSAINHGIDRSEGDYLIFMGSDDILYREYLAKASKRLSETKAEVLLSGYYFFEVAGVPKGGETAVGVTRAKFIKQMAREVIGPPHSHIVSRTLVQKVGNFDETLRSAEDWDLFARIARVFTSFATLDYTGAGYRLRPGSLSRDAKVMLDASIEVARRVRENDPRLPADQRICKEPIEPVIVHHLLKHCGDLLFTGRQREAGELFQATVAEHHLAVRPRDCRELISYLQFPEVATPEARKQFWSKHVGTISDFLLLCENVLQKNGFYGASITYLTADWLQPDDMAGIVPFIPTRHLLGGGAKTLARKALIKLQVSLGILRARPSE